MSNQKQLQKHLLSICLGLLIVAIVTTVVYFFFQKPVLAPTPEQTPLPGSQLLVPGEPLAAEMTGLTFMDRVLAYSDTQDLKTAEDILQLLSPELRTQFSESSLDLQADLLALFNISAWPDQGFSVEDLQFQETTASLIFGLNYSSTSRVLREVALAHTQDGWKVTAVEIRTTYPPAL
jgi:hypothetical protein